MVLVECPWCAEPAELEDAGVLRCDSCLVTVELVDSDPEALAAIAA
jgi:hypothetical protein